MPRQMFGEVEIVPGVLGPERLTNDDYAIGPHYRGPELDPPFQKVSLAIDIRYDPDRSRYVCYGLEVRRDHLADGPVTTEILREIKIEQMIVDNVLLTNSGIIRELDNPDGLEPWGLTGPDALDGPTDRALRWVAHFYRWGYATGYGPTAAAEKALQLTRPTTGRWVRLAREAGYLGVSAGPGRAGI